MPNELDTGSLLLELQEKLDDVAREETRYIFRGRDKFAAIRDAVYERRKEVVMNVKYFWLKALINHPAFSLLITDVDSRILRKLVDVDVAPVLGATHRDDFEIVFTFASNEYFEDQCLVKRYSHSDQLGRVVGTHNIKWKGSRASDLIARKDRGRDTLSGFFRWITTDTRDTSSLGDLFKQVVYPHAIELFFGTYSMIREDPSYVDPRHRAH